MRTMMLMMMMHMMKVSKDLKIEDTVLSFHITLLTLLSLLSVSLIWLHLSMHEKMKGLKNKMYILKVSCIEYGVWSMGVLRSAMYVHKIVLYILFNLLFSILRFPFSVILNNELGILSVEDHDDQKQTKSQQLL